MDSLTHLVLGAVVGEVTARKKLGGKALVLGAVAQYIPDLDVIAALWLSPAENLMVHRGITHSVLFVVFASIFIGWLARHIFHQAHASSQFWISFFALQLTLHIFIDAFNAYGAGWLEPFSSRKISFHTLYVADPVFSFGPVAALIGLLVARSSGTRRVLAFTGLGLSAAYLFFTIGTRLLVINTVKTDLEITSINTEKLLVTPTPLNSILWFVAAQDDSGFYTSHVSLFDDVGESSYTFFPRQDQLLATSGQESHVQTLKTFAQGYYTAEMWGDTLVFNDLRFGQMKGWEDPRSRFVFHYFVDYPEENTLVMQRGRFAGWDSETVRRLLRRMAGAVSPADESKR